MNKSLRLILLCPFVLLIKGIQLYCPQRCAYMEPNQSFQSLFSNSYSQIKIPFPVDSSDNIYVTGSTSGGLDGNTNSGIHDIFLVKYNSSGVKQWTKQLGTSSTDVGNGVTVDSSDNIYVTGLTSGGLDGNTNSGGYDLFLVKYNSDGVLQ